MRAGHSQAGPVITFHFLQLIPALLEVVPMCGHQLGDFLIYFLIPSFAVELPLYPFFGHQREERLDLLDRPWRGFFSAKPFSLVRSVVEEQRGFKKWWVRVLCLFTVWSVVARLLTLLL